MKNCRLSIFFFFCFFINPVVNGQKQSVPVVIGERFQLQSNVLNEERSFQIYLPHSYSSSLESRYAVMYLMDGDYNFHHITGLIEQLSSIGERIPQMIVVGISDKGHTKYQKYCSPKDTTNPTSTTSGNADVFLKFIDEELITYINNNYRTTGYDILTGHSLGGLFTITALLTRPDIFDAYIAISPSLWWNDFLTEKMVPAFFNDNEEIDKFLYISLANEKGMGVYGFVNQLDIYTFIDQYEKNPPLGLDWTFTHLKKENHNSVGLRSVNLALDKLFKNWNLDNEELKEFKSFKEYSLYFQKFSNKHGKRMKLPSRQIRYFVNRYFDENLFDEIKLMRTEIHEKFPASIQDFENHIGNVYIKQNMFDEGLQILKTNKNNYPNSAQAESSLGDAYVAINNNEEALKSYQKALELAEVGSDRQWFINQLLANIELIKNK